jgi:hypothetical protein
VVCTVNAHFGTHPVKINWVGEIVYALYRQFEQLSVWNYVLRLLEELRGFLILMVIKAREKRQRAIEKGVRVYHGVCVCVKASLW